MRQYHMYQHMYLAYCLVGVICCKARITTQTSIAYKVCVCVCFWRVCNMCSYRCAVNVLLQTGSYYRQDNFM